MIETSDLIFAIDSIPAVFAITEDPFLVFTSNIMAVLGATLVVFRLGGHYPTIHYLRLSLSLILVLIGTKMLLKDILHALPDTTYYTLGAICLILSWWRHSLNPSGTADS